MLCLCCSFLLALFPCCGVGSLPQEGYSPCQTVALWVLPTGCGSSKTAPAWTLSMRYSPSGMDCSSMGPTRTAAPASKPAPAWALHGLQLLSGHIHLLWRVVLRRVQCGYLLWCGPLWAAGAQPASLQVFSMGCSGIPAPAPGAPPSPPPSLTLVSAGLFISRFSCLSYIAAVQHFLPFLTYVIDRGTTSTVDGPSFGKCWVCRGASWNWLCPMWEEPLVSQKPSLHPSPPNPAKTPNPIQ